MNFAQTTSVYHGGAPFNQLESQAARDFVNKNIIGEGTPVYIALHSYGQYVLTPWGYTNELPDDYDQLYALALNATEKLSALYGTRYTIGTSTNLLGNNYVLFLSR